MTIARSSRRALPLILALLVAGAPAFAADWLPLGRTFGGNDVFVDAVATRRLGDLRTTWVRVVYPRGLDVEGKRAHSTEALAHFDCRTGSSAGVAVIFYDDGGRELKHAVEETVRFYVDPDGSFGALARVALCR
jgi:hypothetical protein